MNFHALSISAQYGQNKLHTYICLAKIDLTLPGHFLVICPAKMRLLGYFNMQQFNQDICKISMFLLPVSLEHGKIYIRTLGFLSENICH